MVGDKPTNAIFRYIARPCYAGDLEQGSVRRDLRIEAARRGRHQIGWHRRRWIFLPELVDVALDTVDQRLVRWTEVRSARIGRVDGAGTVFVASLGSAAVVAEGRPWKYLSLSNCWPISSEPTIVPLLSIRLPCA